MGEQGRAVERLACEQPRRRLQARAGIEDQRGARFALAVERQAGGVAAVADEVDAGCGARSPHAAELDLQTGSALLGLCAAAILGLLPAGELPRQRRNRAFVGHWGYYPPPIDRCPGSRQARRV